MDLLPEKIKENEILLELDKENELAIDQVQKSESEEERSGFMKKLISSGISHGVPNCFLTTDYYMMMMIIKNFFVAGGNSELGAASAFFTVYYSLLLHVTNLALNDTQGILGSKDIGKINGSEDKRMNQDSEKIQHRKPFLRFKQSVITGLLIFSFLCLAPSFFFKYFLMRVLNIDERLAIISQDMVVWALPGMAVRIVNDCLKTLLQNYKHSRILGYCYIVLVVLFGVFSAVIIFYLKLKASSTGVILFFFELFGLILCFYFLKDLKSKKGWKSLDFSLVGISEEISLFLKQFLNFWIVDAPNYFVYEIQNFIISFTYSNEQIAVYTLNSTLVYLTYSLSVGFGVEARTMISREIGKNNLIKVRKYLKGFKILFIYLSAILTVLYFLFFQSSIKMEFYGKEGNFVREILDKLSYLWLIRCISLYFSGLQINLLKSAGMNHVLHYFYTIPSLFVPVFSFILCLYFGYGGSWTCSC